MRPRSKFFLGLAAAAVVYASLTAFAGPRHSNHHCHSGKMWKGCGNEGQSRQQDAKKL